MEIWPHRSSAKRSLQPRVTEHERQHQRSTSPPDVFAFRPRPSPAQPVSAGLSRCRSQLAFLDPPSHSSRPAALAHPSTRLLSLSYGFRANPINSISRRISASCCRHVSESSPETDSGTGQIPDTDPSGAGVGARDGNTQEYVRWIG